MSKAYAPINEIKLIIFTFIYLFKHAISIYKFIIFTQLNSLSKEWAEHLAKNRIFYHKPHNEYGENIYWENYQTGLHYPSMFVHAWYNEQIFFRRNMRFSELHLVSK